MKARFQPKNLGPLIVGINAKGNSLFAGVDAKEKLGIQAPSRATRGSEGGTID